ncbi:MAG: hypothetical protein JST54_21270 [Deltaproteobacteria bacterium]|nr:hypothetical protein [Deltaproteobacteria bacterium]
MATRSGGTGDLKPAGESLKQALRWISNEREDRPNVRLGELVEQASVRYDLSPAEEQFLLDALTRTED